MKTKVTLSLDKDFVKEAKKFAAARHTSLSALVTDSVNHLKNELNEQEEKKKALKTLSGSINLPKEIAEKGWDELRWEALKDKHAL